MNYNNNDDNRIRRKKVSSNDYNYKSKQHQRYYKEKVRLDNASYERKIENNKIVEQVFKKIAHHNITKFVVEEASLNEIFIAKVGASYDE